MTFPMHPAKPIRQAIDALLARVHTALPATVVRYDKATQTALCRPAVRPPVQSAADEDSDVYEALPDVLCPVVYMRAGGWFVHAKLAPGDGVLVVFSQADHEAYRATGRAGDPQDNRVFSISHGWAIPGCFARAEALPGLSDDLELGHATGLRVRLGVTAMGVGVDPADPLAHEVQDADKFNLFLKLLQFGLGSISAPMPGPVLSAAIDAAITAMGSLPGGFSPPTGPGPFGAAVLKVPQ